MRNKISWKIIVGVIGLFLVILICSLAVGSMGNSEAKEHIDLGNKYMEDLDYEQAIAEYMTALEIDPVSEQAASGLENASVRYAEELLAGDLPIEECNGLLNTLEDSYGVIPKESIENKIVEVEQVIREKEEEERIAREREEKIRKEQEEKREQEEKAKREQEEREKKEREEKEKREQEEKEREEQKAENKEMEESINQQQTDNWVDDLYNKMIAGDSEGVFAIILADDFIKKCEEYEYYTYKSVVPHEYLNARFYLLTSDGKEVWGNYYFDEYDNEDWRNVIYSHIENEHSGVYGGDYVYEYDISNNEKWWLCGTTIHENDGTTHEINNGYMLWVYL